MTEKVSVEEVLIDMLLISFTLLPTDNLLFKVLPKFSSKISPYSLSPKPPSRFIALITDSAYFLLNAYNLELSLGYVGLG